jgi:hypothetical protein
MAVLLMSEVFRYRAVGVENHLMVDTTQGDREVQVSLEIDFPALLCKDAALRVEDAKGITYDDVRIHIGKHPLVRGDRGARGARGARWAAKGRAVRLLAAARRTARRVLAGAQAAVTLLLTRIAQTLPLNALSLRSCRLSR